jgi:hypothetical protein
MSDLVALWGVAALLIGVAVFCLSVGGWLGVGVAAVYGYFGVDLARFALRLRRLRAQVEQDLL